jgi:murein DD-endopeptidase MepM/ murein hydrolase activator NlpD
MAKTKRFRRIVKWILVLVLILIAVFIVLFYYSTEVTQNMDSYTYTLPFKPQGRYRVVQGYGGLFSHKHIAALDFDMPIGTPVHAARSGTIYSYRDNNDEGGPYDKYRSKANYIIIKHEDGSFGCYWHLQRNGVLVKHGHVAAGEQIGLSGATGFALSPHLHFAVKRKLGYAMDAFTRTRFSTTDGVAFLETGSSYERPLQ